MSELVGRHEDVADPFGGTAQAYERTVARMEKLIAEGMPNLFKWLDRNSTARPPTQAARLP